VEDVVIFFTILFGLLVLGIVGIIIFNWWRDEQEKVGKRIRSREAPSLILPALSGISTALHPSIDPYLNELRTFLLTPPLPQGPGEMAERVYTHLTQWVNEHLTYDAEHTIDVDDELLTGPVQRFVDASYNDPPEYLEIEEP